MLGDVVEFFEQGEITVGFDIAHGARVAVPIPGAAEVAGLFNHPNIVKTGLLEPSAHEPSAKAPADDGHLHLVIERIAFDALGVGIVVVSGEIAANLLVLRIAVFPEPFVTFV